MTLAPPQAFRKTAGIHRLGLVADRPVAVNVLPGTLYFSTDTGVLERSNGQAWDTYGPSGAGSSSIFLYRADTQFQTASDPGAGRMHWNSPQQAQATALYFDRLTTDGFDVILLFTLMTIAAEFILQETDFSLNYQRWKMTAPALTHADWFEVPVTFVTSSGAGTFSNNQSVAALINVPGQVPAHHATHQPGGTDVLQVSGPNVLLGRGDSTGGPIQELALSPSLIMTDTTLSVRTGIVNYTYNSTLTAPPAAGQCRLNAAFPWTAATTLWLRFVSADGQDLYWAIMLLPVGATLLLQDKDDHTRYGRFTLTAVPTDQGLYAALAVSWQANGTAIVTAQQVFLRVAGSL